MDQLSGWLDSFRTLRASFERLSLQHPNVYCCLWWCDDDNHLEKLYAALIPGDYEPEDNPHLGSPNLSHWTIQLGMAGLDAFGDAAPGWHVWWLSHAGVARAAQEVPRDEHALVRELRLAESIKLDFVNHADHAGNLLVAIPTGAELKIADEFKSHQARNLWLLTLFGSADHGPDSRIRTSPFLPSFVSPAFSSGVHFDFLKPTWQRLRTLTVNPFQASVVLLDMLLKAAISEPAPSLSDPRPGAKTYFATELCREIGISARSLNKYAKAAGVQTPLKGQRNFRYGEDARLKILATIMAVSSASRLTTSLQKIAINIGPGKTATKRKAGK